MQYRIDSMVFIVADPLACNPFSRRHQSGCAAFCASQATVTVGFGQGHLLIPDVEDVVLYKRLLLLAGSYVCLASQDKG